MAVYAMAVFRGIELYVRAITSNLYAIQKICYALLIIDSFIKKFTYIQCKYYTIRTFVLERIFILYLWFYHKQNDFI